MKVIVTTKSGSVYKFWYRGDDLFFKNREIRGQVIRKKGVWLKIGEVLDFEWQSLNEYDEPTGIICHATSTRIESIEVGI